MASLALELILWLTGVRGHIPGLDEFRPAAAAPAVGISSVISVLAISASVLAVLSFAVWGTVWIAIQLF